MNYESNEAMYAKLKSGAVSYDIIIPSDYMIERLKNEDMLQKLDMSKITTTTSSTKSTRTSTSMKTTSTAYPTT